MAELQPLYRATKDGKTICLYAPLEDGRVLVVLTTSAYGIVSEERFRTLTAGYTLQASS